MPELLQECSLPIPMRALSRSILEVHYSGQTLAPIAKVNGRLSLSVWCSANLRIYLSF
jgi:hypothetical protein